MVYQVNHATNRSGKAYVVAWVTPAGRKTAKFADPGDALDEAKTQARLLAAGRVEASSMSCSQREEYVAARKLAGAIPLLSALEEWGRARALCGGELMRAAEAWAAKGRAIAAKIKVGELIDLFMQAKTASGLMTATAHAPVYKHVRAALGERWIDELTAVDLGSYLAGFSHPVTRNTRRKRIVTLWRWAQRRGYLPRNTKTEAELTDLAKEEAPHVGIITPETYHKLLQFVRDHHPDLLASAVLAGFCGLRRDEIHGQRWDDVVIDKKFVRVTKAKRGTPANRIVPLCDAALEWLAHCGESSGPVGPSLAVDRLRKVCIAAGFKLPENAFRHSYISHRVAATGNVPQAALDAGNSPKIIHRHYREPISKEQGEAWFAPTICGPAPLQDRGTP